MFVLNKNGHYFKIDTNAVVVDKAQLDECRFFADEKALLDVVCSESGLDLEEVEGTTFHITMQDDQPILIDDRGLASSIDEPVEKFVATFCL